jgi:hypothetical protein
LAELLLVGTKCLLLSALSYCPGLQEVWKELHLKPR